MAQMNVSFDDRILEDLQELIPVRKRSLFISEAVREKLELFKQEQAVRAAAGAWGNETKQLEDPEKKIRRLRKGWRGRLDRTNSKG